MSKAPRDIVMEQMFSVFVEAVGQIRGRNVDNAIAREFKAITPNTQFEDLSPRVQETIRAGADAAFFKLLSEGYTVATRHKP